MAPITTNKPLKRHPTIAPEEAPSRKRIKLEYDVPSTIRFRHRREARKIVSENITQANALDPARFTETYIPKDRQLFTTKDGKRNYMCTFQRVSDLTPGEFSQCFKLIEETSRADYETHAVGGWDPDYKKEEMKEENMRFILVRRSPDSEPSHPQPNPPNTLEDDNIIQGFTSFTLELDPSTGTPQIFIYEIHLTSSLRGLGLGKHLISLNEYIAQQVGLEKSMLTVFTSNTGAEAMYRKMGYAEDESSPETRKLRGGKVVRPKYLILSKAF